MNEEEKKRRNYVIAGTVGGFLLPLAGIVGALVFYTRDDQSAAWALLAGSLTGIVFYVLLFGVA